MNNTFVYVNDVLVDLLPGTVIAYTYQNTVIPEITTRRVSYTNQFKAPFTENNIKIFEYAQLIKAKQQFTVKNVRIVQNGFELVRRGKAVVWRTNEAFEVSVYDGIVNFVDALGDETIDQLYSIDTTLHTWNQSTIDSKRNAVVGLVAPVMSYGQFIPVQVLENASFVDSTIWEQIQRTTYDEQWTIGSGEATCQVQSFTNTTVDLERNGTSYLVRQPYKFAKDQEYDISFTYYYSGDRPRLVVHLLSDDGADLEIPFPTASASATTETETVTPSRNYEYIAFEIILDPPPTTGSDTGSITIEEIEIADVLKIGNTLPSVYYRTIFNQIVEDAGYTHDFSSLIFNRMFMPFSKDELKYTGFFNQCREFRAVRTTSQTISSDGNVLFDSITTKDLFGLYDPTTGTYDTASPYQGTVTIDTRDFYVRLFTSLQVRVVSGTAEVMITDGAGSEVLASQTLNGAGTYQVNLEVNGRNGSDDGYLFDGGGSLSVRVELTGVGASVVMLPGSEFWVEVNGVNLETTPRFYACEILPEMKKSDFFKDLVIRFGLIPWEKNNALYFKTYDQVISDKAASLDWTDKRDTSRPDEVVYESDLARKNYFVYPSNDKFFRPTFSRGTIESDNIDLQPENTLYESMFNGSVDISVGDGADPIYCGLVPIWNNPPDGYQVGKENQFDEEPGLRLMITRERTVEPEVFYNGNARTDYKIGNFLLPDEGYLSWQKFINDNYRTLANAIRQNKGVIRYYNLSDVDMNLINPHRMVYDDGAYYIVNQISNFVPGQLTKVWLFKVQ